MWKRKLTRFVNRIDEKCGKFYLGKTNTLKKIKLNTALKQAAVVLPPSKGICPEFNCVVDVIYL
jgi:hypothetical protein